MKSLFILIFYLLAITPAGADSLATIGKTTRIINKLTSCAPEKWESSQVNACACCLAKENGSSSVSPDKTVGTCLKNKYCTIKALSQLAPGQQSAEDIVNVILWNVIDTPTITINTDYLNQNGNLKADKVVDFLASLQKNLRDLNATMQSDFSKTKCIETKDLGAGGANTA